VERKQFHQGDAAQAGKRNSAICFSSARSSLKPGPREAGSTRSMTRSSAGQVFPNAAVETPVSVRCRVCRTLEVVKHKVRERGRGEQMFACSRSRSCPVPCAAVGAARFQEGAEEVWAAGVVPHPKSDSTAELS